jgi:hypothetical protein
MGNQGQTNRANIMGRDPSAGRPGGVGYTAPPETQKRMADYYAGQKEYENRGFGHKLLDFLGGPFYNENEPAYGNPDTFHGGSYHTSTNPLGVAGSILGSLVPGGGTVLGAIGNQIGPEAYHHPASDTQIAGYGMNVGGPPNQNPTQTGQSPIGGNTGSANPMAQALMAPSGASFGAQPAAQPGMQPQSPFGKIPNHTLPQGYESLFPNSLTAEDKALLYGKALMG